MVRRRQRAPGPPAHDGRRSRARRWGCGGRGGRRRRSSRWRTRRRSREDGQLATGLPAWLASQPRRSLRPASRATSRLRPAARPTCRGVRAGDRRRRPTRRPRPGSTRTPGEVHRADQARSCRWDAVLRALPWPRRPVAERDDRPVADDDRRQHAGGGAATRSLCRSRRARPSSVQSQRHGVIEPGGSNSAVRWRPSTSVGRGLDEHRLIMCGMTSRSNPHQVHRPAHRPCRRDRHRRPGRHRRNGRSVLGSSDAGLGGRDQAPPRRTAPSTATGV